MGSIISRLVVGLPGTLVVPGKQNIPALVHRSRSEPTV